MESKTGDHCVSVSVSMTELSVCGCVPEHTCVCVHAFVRVLGIGASFNVNYSLAGLGCHC